MVLIGFSLLWKVELFLPGERLVFRTRPFFSKQWHSRHGGTGQIEDGAQSGIEHLV
jgi:hypothetical protein